MPRGDDKSKPDLSSTLNEERDGIANYTPHLGKNENDRKKIKESGAKVPRRSAN